MQFTRSRDVPALTGLTSDQIREWTVRRDLIRPDIPAQKRGSEAQFSWQTLLVLRLAVVLKTRFHVELQAHRDLLISVRSQLQGETFHGLWGARLVIYGLSKSKLCTQKEPVQSADEDVIVLHLNRHLEVLSQGLKLPDPFAQLPLFPVVGIKSVSDDLPSNPVPVRRTASS